MTDTAITPTDDQRLAALYWELNLRPMHEDSGAPGDTLTSMRRSYVRDVVTYAIEGVRREFAATPHPAQAVGYLLPPLFAGNLGDALTRRPYIEALGHDPLGRDDTVFGTSFVYCASHHSVHSTGWCTVGIDQKVPLASVRGTDADLLRAQDEARALGLHIFQDTVDYWGQP